MSGTGCMYRSFSLVFFQQCVLLPSPSLMEWQGVMPLHWYLFLSLSQGLPLPDCFFTGHVSWMKYWTVPGSSPIGCILLIWLRKAPAGSTASILNGTVRCSF